MARPTPPELVEFLRPFPEPVLQIVVGLRTRVLRSMPRAHETVWDATNAVALGYSPTTPWQDGIVHIATYSAHVNLGFNRGAGLPDPLDLFAGTGTQVRHVSIRSEDDVDAPWIDDYLATAMAAVGVDATMGDGGTTVRVSNGPKRRPA